MKPEGQLRTVLLAGTVVMSLSMIWAGLYKSKEARELIVANHSNNVLHAGALQASSAASGSAARTGVIAGRVSYGGILQEIKPLLFPEKIQKEIGSEIYPRNFVVNSNRELADVVISIENPPAGYTRDLPNAWLSYRQYQIYPYVMALQTKQELTITSERLCNCHLTTLSGPIRERNIALISGETKVTFESAGLVRPKCDVHPWEISYIFVFDHPYFAVTTTNGGFQITNVPPGKYRLRAHHRRCGTQVKEVHVSRNGTVACDFLFTL